LPQRVGGDIIAVEIFAGKKELNMPSLGGWELLIILVIVIVIFGAGRLSEIGGALGKSIREFRESSTVPNEENDEQDESSVSESKA
jgi:sec-independent protein translocase protein TatA